jgi:uncharacterized membrane protein
MSTQLHNELKKEFQLERMIFFSDAVFAIAITLLVIEIKIPDIHENVSDKLLLAALAHLIPKFFGFIVSFFLIGLYWTVHHRMFGFVINYTPRLLRLNILFLFFIALMPFATGFYGEYAGAELFIKQLKVPMTFYVLNISCVGIFNYIMWVYISNPKNKLIDHTTDRLTLKLARIRSIAVPIIFLCMLPVAYFIHVVVAVYIPMFIPLVMKITARYYTKKAKPAIAQ